MTVIQTRNPNWPWSVMLPARFSDDRKRKARYFKTKTEAVVFCNNVKKYGISAVHALDARSTTEQDGYKAAIRYAEKTLGNQALVYRAIEHFQKTRLNVKPATVREAVEAFQAWRQTQVKAGKLKQSTVQSDFDRLNKLITEFDVVQLVEITSVLLREFFDSMTGDQRSVYKSVRIFFGWAFERGYLGENPMAMIKPVGEYGINNEYYPVDTFRRMIRIAAGLDPIKPGGDPTREFADMLPYFVLGGFLGLRRCEALRLTRRADSIRWDDLHFDTETPNVEVREEVAKSTARATDIRYVESPQYLEAFKAWMPFIPQKGPRIVHWTNRQMQELKRRFTKATKIKFIENGFRNSFATYALTFNGLQGVGKLALEMGNSEAICKRHYVKNIAPGSGRAWFSLRPFEVVLSESTSARA